MDLNLNIPGIQPGPDLQRQIGDLRNAIGQIVGALNALKAQVDDLASHPDHAADIAALNDHVAKLEAWAKGGTGV